MPRKNTPRSASSSTNNFVLTASLAADGSLQLSGTGLVNNVIEIPTGEDATVEIGDITGLYVYGAELPPSGATPGGWTRDVTQGQTARSFLNVTADVYSFVFAADTGDSTKIKYGPVITIKPKG